MNSQVRLKEIDGIKIVRFRSCVSFLGLKRIMPVKTTLAQPSFAESQQALGGNFIPALTVF